MSNEAKKTTTLTFDLSAVKPRRISNIVYIVGLLLFFLPFINIKCNNTVLASVSGKDLITGFNIEDKTKSSSLSDLFFKDKKSGSEDSDKEESNTGSSHKKNTQKDDMEKPSIIALLSFFAGLTAGVCSFLKMKNAGIAAAVSGGIAAGLLLTLFLQLQSDLRGVGAMGIGITAGFTFWFFLCLLSFGAGAFFSYRFYLYDTAEKKQAEMEEYAAEYNYINPVNNTGENDERHPYFKNPE